MSIAPVKPALNLLLLLLMVSDSGLQAAQHEGPERVWGEVSSIYRSRENGGSDHRNTNLRNTGTINASTYIWRSWFALLSGSLSLSVDETDSEGQPAAEDRFTTGDLQFDLFPTSRFPFRAYYIKTDNQFDNDVFDRQIFTTEYGLSQQYRTPDGKHHYRAEFSNRRQEQDDDSEFASDSLLLSASNRFGRQDLNTDVKLDQVDNLGLDEQARSYSLTLDHALRQATNFTIDNLVSTSVEDNDLFSASNDVETSQLSSFLSWHPENRRDIRLTGSLRLSETRFEQQQNIVVTSDPVETSTEAANLNQGLIYEYSKNLQLSESLNANLVDNDGQEISTTSAALSARYSADRQKTRIGEYGWTLGTTYNSLQGDQELTRSLDNQFSHSLLNDYSVEKGYQLRGNLTQSLNYEVEDNGDEEKDIDHSYSLTWSDSAINNQNLIRFFISDSRSLDPEDEYFQLINFQYTGTNRLSRHARLSGNLTLQRTNQRFDGERSRQTVGNGAIEYRHQRAFGVPGMMFSSRLILSKRQTETERLTSDPNEDPETAWENSLRYRIGRLETQVDIDFVRTGDEYDQLFKFQLKRSFGDL